ncbi:class I tRNA ligase family protein, partial [Planctomycetota bacterium]
LFKQSLYEHEYPFCWRCECPLLYYARASWFIKTTAFKDELLKNNDSIGWYPDNIRSGRFGDFLRNNVDWALSRERYWGTPLNIWECEACEERESMPSVAALRERNPEIPEDLDPHRPHIDEATFGCAKCKGTMKRVPEVIDCWFDAGSMPFAQWGYPHTGRDIFDESFPCDFISEAIDQTRGWFYSLLAISTILFGKSSYKNCLVLGHVCDKNGKKMSKRLGNYTDPWEVMEKQGADAMRWYFYSSNHPWVNVRFFEEAVTESQKDFLMTLKNVYAFFTIYANIDGFNPGEGIDGYGQGFSGHADYVPANERTLIDRWFMSLLQDTVGVVRDRLEHYDIYTACAKLSACVDGLSNWYVRRSRDRFWKSEKDADKMGAYWTLYEGLETLARVLAPFTPFITEEMYQNLVRKQFKGSPESVHLCAYPEADTALIDEALMKEMEIVRGVVATGRATRNGARLKTRQPLKDVTVILVDPHLKDRIAPYVPIIQEELNVKEVIFADNADDYVTYDIKPNFKLLGPKLGKQVKLVGRAMGAMSLDEKRALVDGGMLEVDGQSIELSADELDVRITAKEGYAAEEGAGMVVVLNTEINDELVAEGLAREIVNRIQNMRKTASLEYQTRIETTISGDDEIKAVVGKFSDIIKSETLSTNLTCEDAVEGTEWQIDDRQIVIRIVKT